MKEPQAWLVRAKDTAKFHRARLLENNRWRITMTAKALHRSFGSVCEDLTIAKWCKTHENQIERFEYAYEALEFIRKKKQDEAIE